MNFSSEGEGKEGRCEFNLGLLKLHTQISGGLVKAQVPGPYPEVVVSRVGA